MVETLVGISILAILVALLVPGIRVSIERANLTKCASNLRQWGMGFQAYMNDNDGYLPQQAEVAGQSDTNWQELIAPYLTGDQKNWNYRNVLRAKFRCPGDKTTGIVYGGTLYLRRLNYNKAPAKLTALNQRHSDFVLLSENYTGEFWDLRADSTPPTGGRIDYGRHKVGGKTVANFLFADFHVEALSHQQAIDRPVLTVP